MSANPHFFALGAKLARTHAGRLRDCAGTAWLLWCVPVERLCEGICM